MGRDFCRVIVSLRTNGKINTATEIKLSCALSIQGNAGTTDGDIGYLAAVQFLPLTEDRQVEIVRRFRTYTIGGPPIFSSGVVVHGLTPQFGDASFWLCDFRIW